MQSFFLHTMFSSNSTNIKHTFKLFESLFNSYVFYCFFLIHYIVFNSNVFYCFMISAVWDLHWDQFSGVIYKLNTKLKRTNLLFTNQNRNHTLPFVLYTNWKNLIFRVDVWLPKVMWLLNRMSDFHKLGVKISVRLQRKK